MAYIITTLVVVSALVIINLYFGIWGSILEAFSDEKIRNELLVASRMVEYEKARLTTAQDLYQPLSYFHQAEKLSQHQQEVFKEILNRSNRELLPKFILFIGLLAWASIYLTHKIAGPIYRFNVSLMELRDGNMKIRIHLRRGDEAQSVAKTFNMAAESLDTRFSNLQSLVEQKKEKPKELIQDLEHELNQITTSKNS